MQRLPPAIIARESGLKIRQVYALKTRLKNGGNLVYRKGRNKKLSKSDIKELNMMMLIPNLKRLPIEKLRLKFLKRIKRDKDYIKKSCFWNYLTVNHSFKRATKKKAAVLTAKEMDQRKEFALHYLSLWSIGKDFVYIDE